MAQTAAEHEITNPRTLVLTQIARAARLPSDIQTGDTVSLQLNVTLSYGDLVSSNLVTIGGEKTDAMLL